MAFKLVKGMQAQGLEWKARENVSGRLLSSRPTPWQPPEGKLDGGEGNKVGQGIREVLEVLAKPPIWSDSGEGALDHPAT
jgi:hypothetical protein